MARITWKAREGEPLSEMTGEVGALCYTVRSPKSTPGWRVWVHLNHFGSSVGGTIVTMKAATVEAAMDAAEEHLRSFVAGLVGKNGVLELMGENARLRLVVNRLAEGERSDEGHTALREAANAALAWRLPD